MATIKKRPFKGQIRVLDQLEELLPRLSDEQVKSLEDSLIAEGGAYDPLWLWGDILVDGHNRYRLCRKHNLPYETKQVYESAETIEDVEFRMKQAACGQRNMPATITSRLRAEMVQYLVAKQNKPKGEAIAEVAKTARMSERQVFRDLEKLEAMRDMHESARGSEAVNLLSLKQVQQFALLSKEEQHASIERAGYDGERLAGEVRRMATVEGTPLFNQEKADKEKAANEKRAEENKKGLFAVCQESLADAGKKLKAVKKAHNISQGQFSRLYGYLLKVDEGLAKWKKEIEDGGAK